MRCRMQDINFRSIDSSGRLGVKNQHLLILFINQYEFPILFSANLQHLKVKKIVLIICLLLVFCALVFGLYQTNTKSNLQVIDANEDTFVKTTLVERDTLKMTSLEDSIVNFALTYLGTPYVYGACSKDKFDCSGFVYFDFKHFNIDVPRSSSQYGNFGKTIPKDKMKKGDILVFLSPTRNEIGHLGIVTETNGESVQFIHASSGKEMQVILSDLSNQGYKRCFVKAIRVI